MRVTTRMASRAAEHGIAADRFAREIVAFLTRSYAARSRQLNANPFGTRGKLVAFLFRFGSGESGFLKERCASSVVQKWFECPLC